MGKGPEQSLLQKIYTKGQQVHVKMFSITHHQEMQIKTIIRYHLRPVRMAILKKTRESKCWHRCGEKGSLVHCWRDCKLVQPLQKAVWRVLKKLKIELLYIISNSTSGNISKGNRNTNLKRYLHPHVPSIIYNSQHMKTT